MSTKIVKVLDERGERKAGVCTYITYERLIASGIIQQTVGCRSGEQIVQLEVDDNGIKFYIEPGHEHVHPDYDD